MAVIEAMLSFFCVSVSRKPSFVRLKDVFGLQLAHKGLKHGKT